MRRFTGVSRLARTMLAASLVVGLAAGAVPASAATTAVDLSAKPGLARILAVYGGADYIRGIATFSAVPTASQVTALRALGLGVQPMKHVPLALVRGTVAKMQTAVTQGKAVDVYPDEKIELLDQASADAMGAAGPRASGYTGKGVTVAVVDSGCDATHPDLADHVAHNVKLYSPEYVNGSPDGANTIVVPSDQGPYSNTDIAGGHGTHVAGIIAADGTSDPTHLGVAPDAELVCMSIGEVLFTTAVVTAYDYLMDRPQMWGVDVINNSWGNSFRMFDPRDPVHVVTKAVTDLGAAVVFAAGNSGYAQVEMSLNPFSSAPWVISVAAGAIDHTRGNFSSSGLKYDNSIGGTLGAGQHTVYTGNRIGVYHPDVTAPGVDIASSCTPTGVAIGPCPEYEQAVASGTSMAAPHVAGAVAVLRQIRPSLNLDQLRQALQATATPVVGGTQDPTFDFWQVGYGYVDLAKAVALVKNKKPSTAIAAAQRQADARVLGSVGYTLKTSDFWTYPAPNVVAAGSDTRTYTVAVPSTVTDVKVTLSHPSLAVACCNLMFYEVEVRDAAGKLLGTTTEPLFLGAGTASALIDLTAVEGGVTYGSFTFTVIGTAAASDPDTIDSESLLGRLITLHVAQMVKK